MTQQLTGLASNLTSISWWFTVVLAGLVINVLAAYLKARLDTFLATVSTRARQQRAEDEEQTRAIVAYLAASSDALLAARFREVFFLLIATMSTIIGVVFLVGATLAGLLLEARPSSTQAKLLIALFFTLCCLAQVVTWVVLERARRQVAYIHEAENLRGRVLP